MLLVVDAVIFMKSGKILVTGAAGQIGSELVPALREKYGKNNVVALYHSTKPEDSASGPFEIADATDKSAMKGVIEKHGINTVYHLVGILSAAGEKDPEKCWKVNMDSLKIFLDFARDYGFERMFWPSSIAAFGPTTPRENTPQHTVLEPSTMYGATKVSGELLASYYWKKYGVDTRSIRYPGLNSWKTPPGGGTTDYAVGIYYDALQKGSFECFLSENTYLPMMYMDDAVRGTIDLMEADLSKVPYRIAYNFSAMSFCPREIFEEIRKRMPEFKISYKPDFRQKIADSWPKSIDDSQARWDWGWKHEYGLSEMTDAMLENLRKKFGMKD
jgi:nucleoside-diphosphate-sugar epimerase